MKATREAIMTAFVDLLSGATFAAPVHGKTGWASVSRRLKLWSDVPRGARPALFVVEHREDAQYQSEALPPKVTLNVDLFVYIDASDKNATPATDLNILLDAIEAALKPAPSQGQRQTLGGLVSHCRIDGQVMKDPGDIDGDGLLWAPVKIFAV